MHPFFYIQNATQFICIAAIVLPVPILMLATPLNRLHEKIMRYKYYTIVKKQCENPYDVTEEKLSKIFPDKTQEQLELIAYYLEEEYVFMVN